MVYIEHQDEQNSTHLRETLAIYTNSRSPGKQQEGLDSDRAERSQQNKNRHKFKVFSSSEIVRRFYTPYFNYKYLPVHRLFIQFTWQREGDQASKQAIRYF